MKFLVREYHLSQLPLGVTAKKETLTYLDYRTVPTMEEAKKYSWYKEWFGGGKNHREDKNRGMIVCEVQQDEFIIEIKSLSNLVKLLESIDEVSITKCEYLEVKLQFNPDPER